MSKTERMTTLKEPEPGTDIRTGITASNVLRVFPGARIARTEVDVDMDENRIRLHWQQIAEWMNRKPRTTRYMLAEERAALEEEIALPWRRREQS